MRLNQTAEYALRAMTGLSLGPPEGPVRAQELSATTGVPLPYLWKILRRLGAAGLVHAAKGHGGGFRLSRPPERISFMDILASVGYAAEAEACVFGWGRCRADRPCPMHQAWCRLDERFRSWAEGTTLADLKAQPARANPFS